MDVPQYKLVDASFNVRLQEATRGLNSQETDLCIITEEGEKMYTQRSLLCIYSSSVAKYISDVPCCNSTSISIPVSSLAFNNLMKVLINGFLTSEDLQHLSDVTEAAKILGIELENIDFGSEIDETNIDESYNIKTEPDIGNGGIKKKLKKKFKKGKNRTGELPVKHELVTEEDDVEKLLEDDDGFRKTEKVDDFVSKLSKEKPTCNFCGKKFSDNYKLNRHITTHTEERSFACDQCQKCFSRKDKLKVHLNKVHNDPGIGQGRMEKNLNNLNNEQEPLKTKKDIKVKQEHLTTKNDLKVKLELIFEKDEVKYKHVTGEDDLEKSLDESDGKEKPTCNLCGKQYLNNSKLNKHKNTHSLGKSFACYLCPKMFRDTFLLNRHIRTHTGEKPFTCDQCENSFMRKDKLKCHQNTVHPIQY